MNEKLSLTELQLIIRDSLYAALPGFYWVFAEIAEAKENYAGHCYLELVEKHPDDINIKARVRAVIWNTRYRFLKSFFESMTGQTIRAGIKILVRAKVDYHEVYGLSLVINDIDPAFTLGDMALKRQQILKQLENEGVLTMNKELDLPLAPQRIAVVSSASAAGYLDFVKHLKENIYGHAFKITLFEAAMQGTETEQSVISALDRISENAENFDVTVIIRGGGSQTDLSWFDNYNIAYCITQFPLPVITGIGHEKDLTVADLVAYHSLKTPTAVADFLIEKMINAENIISEMARLIASSAEELIEKEKIHINSFIMRTYPAVNLIHNKKTRISGLAVRLINSGKDRLMKDGLIPIELKRALSSASENYISRKTTELHTGCEMLKINTFNIIKSNVILLKSLEESLKILDPSNVLKRGYTITVYKGEIIKSCTKVAPEDEIDTVFHDGKIRSRVLEKSKIKL